MLSEVPDVVWKALADPVRRKILEHLAVDDQTTGEIVELFGDRLSRTGVMKHLDVLEDARLIEIRREGRTRLNVLERAPLKEVAGWISDRTRSHKRNLARLKRLAEESSATE